MGSNGIPERSCSSEDIGAYLALVAELVSVQQLHVLYAQLHDRGPLIHFQ